MSLGRWGGRPLPAVGSSRAATHRGTPEAKSTWEPAHSCLSLGVKTRDGVCAQGAPGSPGGSEPAPAPTQGQSALSEGAETWVGAGSLPPGAPPPALVWDLAARLAPGVLGMAAWGTGCGYSRGVQGGLCPAKPSTWVRACWGQAVPTRHLLGKGASGDGAWCRTASWREAGPAPRGGRGGRQLSVPGAPLEAAEGPHPCQMLGSSNPHQETGHLPRARVVQGVPDFPAEGRRVSGWAGCPPRFASLSPPSPDSLWLLCRGGPG